VLSSDPVPLPPVSTSRSGPSRSRLRRRAGAALVIVATGIGLIGFGPSSPASADITQQIRDSQAQLDKLNTQAELTAERFNAGRIQLAEAQRKAGQAQAAAARANAELTAVRVKVDSIAASSYRRGSGGISTQILSNGNPQTFLDQMAALTQISRSQASVMADLQTARHRQAQATTDAQAAVAQAEATVKGLDKDKADLQSAAAQVQHVLGNLQAKQQQLIQAAKDAAARKAAQARAAQLAAQARATALAAAAFQAQSVAVPAAPTVTTTQHYSGNAAQIAVQAAEAELGKPYQWGASGPDTFDCSGLTMYAYAQAGISLPHFTGDQWNQGRHVSQGELQPGDLVFFEQSRGHVGIYLGGGRFIHAPHTGDVVKISSLTGWYASQYAGAVRLAG
jgi:cell wall-associated NlpC family hydrolase